MCKDFGSAAVEAAKFMRDQGFCGIPTPEILEWASMMFQELL
jgi:hypothetical protein